MIQKTTHLRAMTRYGLLWAVTFVIWLAAYVTNRDQPIILFGVAIPIVCLALALKAAMEHMRVTAPPKRESGDGKE